MFEIVNGQLNAFLFPHIVFIRKQLHFRRQILFSSGLSLNPAGLAPRNVIPGRAWDVSIPQTY